VSETGEFNRLLGKIEGGIEQLEKGQSNIFERLGNVEVHMATASEKLVGLNVRVTKLEDQPRKSAVKWGGLGVAVSSAIYAILHFFAGKPSGMHP